MSKNERMAQIIIVSGRLANLCLLACAGGLALVFASPCFAQSSELITAASKAADLAADKDIVRLSLMAAIVVMVYAGWITKVAMDLQGRVVKALEKIANILHVDVDVDKRKDDPR